MWYSLIGLFNEYQFFEISEKLLEFIKNQDSVDFLLQKAMISMSKQDADHAIEICDQIIQREQNNYKAWIIRGHAFHLKNNLFRR